MKALRLYPPAWRRRYGEELTVLVEELGGWARLSWRLRLDLVRAAVVERVRPLGLRRLPPEERVREGALLVLTAWMLFAIGGFGIQKASEHWQSAVPAGERALPSAAFDTLVVAAAVGSTLVLLGVAVVLPRLARALRTGAVAGLRPPLLRALALSALLAAATVGLGAWAHTLTSLQRNGGDHTYGGVFLAWVALLAATLLAWAAAAAACARRLDLSARELRLEARLGAAVALAMAVVTVATAVWWGAVASAAPWFLDGGPAGAQGSPLSANTLAPALLMLCACALAAVGTHRALRSLGELETR